MKDLFYYTEIYKEWRELIEELIADGCKGSTDCGVAAVLEDFNNYAELEGADRLTFEEMLQLEEYYNYNCL